MEFKYCIIGNILYGREQTVMSNEDILRMDDSDEEELPPNRDPIREPI
jgi:hypothetical protein